MPETATVSADLVCLSHLRWDFVFQRPQHLMSRFAGDRRVFFVEEPVWGSGEARWQIERSAEGVEVAVPHLPGALGREEAEAVQRRLLDELLDERGVTRYVLWYYTPMALGFTSHLDPLATVYDCMDELSLFRFAPPELLAREADLLATADLVFTGGRSLYEAKRGRNPQVHLFPSSIEFEHFASARGEIEEPEDQRELPRPRLGYFGVLDERLDLELIAGLADSRPHWQVVLLGPVVKIDPADLPRRPNLHYLGQKPYAQLPNYLAGWDVALLPFAINDATRFVSPTKTPEYLAAGKPMVSTPITDVVEPYGASGLVRIAGTVEEFVSAVEATLAESPPPSSWLERVDRFLAGNSWDRTQRAMADLIQEVVEGRTGRRGAAPVQPIRPPADLVTSSRASAGRDT